MYCKYGLVCSQLGPKSPPPFEFIEGSFGNKFYTSGPTFFILLFKSFKTNFETDLLERDYKTKQ